jgi:hypothetical protein
MATHESKEASMSTESARPSRVRASDAEREQYASVVRESVGDGRLTLGEGDERLAAIYAAKFRDELRPLVADLPGEESELGRWYPGAPRGRGPHGHGLGHHGHPGLGHPHGRGRDHGMAGWGDPRRRFARHVSFVAFVAVILVSIWAATGMNFFWPVFPLAFLTFGLIRHGMWLRWSAQRR